MPNIDPHNYPGPLEDLEKHQSQNTNNNLGVKIGVIFAIIGVFVTGLGVYIAYSGDDIGDIIESLIEDGGLFGMFPIWFLIFIPFIFTKKKK